MFAPAFHPAMKYVQPIRKGLGFRTVFNILGPLANPAGVQRQVLGVADENLMGTIAQTLKLLGAKVAMVVHSPVRDGLRHNGMDEISTAGVTKIIKLKEGKIESCELNAEDFGIAPANIDDLKVSDAKTSAKILREILNGKESGPRKDIVVLNAAAAIIVSGLADDFGTAIRLANTSVNGGRALACLEKLIEVSNW
jgi:anthranilate phosphoribosyltransferase